MAGQTSEERIDAVRRFNRFYTRQIEILNEKYLRSLFSLAEVRIIYELARRKSCTAAELSDELALDPGFASRILRRLGKRGLMDGRPYEKDGRRTLLRLTAKGQETFGRLNERARRSTAGLLAALSEPEQEKLVRAMGTVKVLLDDPGGRRKSWVIRPHRPGDMGWAVNRHGLLFAKEHDWDADYEALVAGQAAEFLLRRFGRDRCWVAELDGDTAGCALLMEKSQSVAELDLLLVDPPARGIGIGSRLVAQCVESAREAGFRRISLRASTVLSAARHVLQKAGFRVVRRDNQHCFGHYLQFETWELAL
jgi:DNA-binding MarR family transcriptional regulator/GNAT superfamily N-acetyltransferase